MAFIFQLKESVMLRKTVLSVIAVAAFALLLIGTSSSAVADEKAFSWDVKSVLTRGQNSGNTRTMSSIWDRVKRVFQDEEDEVPARSSPRQNPVVIVPPVTVQPPKPLTTAEIQAANVAPAQTSPLLSTNTSVGTPQPRAGSATTTNTRSNINTIDELENDQDTSTLARMRSMRSTVLSNPDLTRAAAASRQASNVPTFSPFPPLGDESDSRDISRDITENFREFSEPSAGPRTSAPPERSTEISSPRTFEHRQPTVPRSEQSMPSQAIVDPFATPSQQVVERIASIEAEQRRTASGTPLGAPSGTPSGRRIVKASPRLEIDIEQPDSVVVNQEITQRIRVTNIGDAPAPGVVIYTEIPSWIDIRHMDASTGNVVLRTRDDGSGMTDLEWKIDLMNQSVTEMLVLRSVSQLHRPIELPIRYDFHRPAIIATVDIKEPKLEMELVGNDEMRWNDVAVYTLFVRNVGNGDAEEIRLELLQTSSEAKDCVFPEPLRPGEEQEMSIQVQARGEQEYIDIAVLATGSHNLRGEVKRRIQVLRPKMEIRVQSDPLHFLDNEAEVTLRVQNVGTADAENVVIRAELPLGARYVSSTEGGLSKIQQQQNIVEWRGKPISRGEVLTLVMVCVPQREGECRVSVEATEPSSGLVLATGSGTFMAEAIVELDLDVIAPKGPIELGREVEYEVHVTNTGTKSADNVEIAMTFGPQLEPTSVWGREARGTEDGQVFFEKIPVILPKQSVAVKVAVRAEGVGTAQIRAEVVRTDANRTPVRLEKGLSAYVFSRQRQATAPEPTTLQ